MRFLVLQHIPIEHPGIFRDFFVADGISWDTVELDSGGSIPSLDGYDSLWVMGGPMDVWEEEQHPWMVVEQRAIRDAVHRGMPFMGVCLGHQLLAAALGGRVDKAAQPEVGVLEIELTAAGRGDPLYAGFASRFKALQWHGAEVAVPPPGAIILARSPLCRVQAMRAGSNAYGLQYHTELTPTTVAEWAPVPAYANALDQALGPGALPRLDSEAEWAPVPAYANALDQALGPGALPRLDAEVRTHMADFNRDSRLLYDNFMTATGLRQRLAT